MEDLFEEVDALFELIDRLYFDMWHRIAAQVILQNNAEMSDTVDEGYNDTTM